MQYYTSNILKVNRYNTVFRSGNFLIAKNKLGIRQALTKDGKEHFEIQCGFDIRELVIFIQ